MTIDSMRVGGGRCPPLIVGGLVIACIMMVCNWWTLSSTNLELLRQIDELNEQIKISVEERDQCVTLRGTFEKQLNDCKVNTRMTHVKLSQVEEDSNTYRKELNSYKQLDLHKTATLDALRVDQKAIKIQLNTLQGENKMLQEEKKQLEEEKKQLEEEKKQLEEEKKQLEEEKKQHEEEKKQLVEEKKKLDTELYKTKNELRIAKLSVNTPSTYQAPLMPIDSNNLAINKSISSAQLAPVKRSDIHVSNKGEKGLLYHNAPILPRDPPGAERKAPRFSVTMLKTHMLGKGENKTSVNVAPKPQVNPPPNTDTQGQEQEKDNSNKEDNAAEVEGVNAMNPSDLNFNLVSEIRA